MPVAAALRASCCYLGRPRPSPDMGYFGPPEGSLYPASSRDRGAEAGQGGAEAELGADLGEQLRVRRNGRQRAVDVVGQRDVGGRPDDRRGDVEVAPRGFELLPRARRESAVALVEGVLQVVQVTEGPDQGGGGLLADAGDAGQAVARVAAQDGEVGVPVAGNVILLGDFRLGDRVELAEALDRVEDADLALVVDELEEVAVAGDDVDRLGRLRGERGDDVVGLVAVVLGDGDARRRPGPG